MVGKGGLPSLLLQNHGGEQAHFVIMRYFVAVLSWKE